jgi:hypothetical protein
VPMPLVSRGVLDPGVQSRRVRDARVRRLCTGTRALNTSRRASYRASMCVRGADFAHHVSPNECGGRVPVENGCTKYSTSYFVRCYSLQAMSLDPASGFLRPFPCLGIHDMTSPFSTSGEGEAASFIRPVCLCYPSYVLGPPWQLSCRIK